jgi:L-amino acid N-acyltransferase YncA
MTTTFATANDLNIIIDWYHHLLTNYHACVSGRELQNWAQAVERSFDSSFAVLILKRRKSNLERYAKISELYARLEAYLSTLEDACRERDKKRSKHFLRRVK